jgi:hypothetical protein
VLTRRRLPVRVCPAADPITLIRGAQNGPSPVDRGRAGSKHHLITDATGIPLAVILTGGNRNDVTQSF